MNYPFNIDITVSLMSDIIFPILTNWTKNYQEGDFLHLSWKVVINYKFNINMISTLLFLKNAIVQLLIKYPILINSKRLHSICFQNEDRAPSFCLCNGVHCLNEIHTVIISSALITFQEGCFPTYASLFEVLNCGIVSWPTFLTYFFVFILFNFIY